MLSRIVEELRFNQKTIENELKEGYSQATEIADTLAKKGIAFREAHAIVGKLVNECRERGITLDEVNGIEQLTEKEWNDALSLDRKRLKKEIKIEEEREKWVKIEMEKIEKIYLKLCQ
jgi:argininosuccinate lyase